MSIKVWEAYKLDSKDNLWPLVRDIYATADQRLREELKQFYYQLMETVDMESDAFKEHRKTETTYGIYPEDPRNEYLNQKTKLSMVDRTVSSTYREVAAKGYNDIFNFDCCVTFRGFACVLRPDHELARTA